MPIPKASKKTPRPRATASHPPPPARRGGLIEPADLQTIVIESADKVAPADVDNFVANHASRTRRTASEAGRALPLFRAQLDLAIDCLRDHHDGRCPQIPYRTISILAAAVLYVADESDLIPDFLQHAGQLDDAAIMATAFNLARDGVERYCVFTGRELPQPATLATSARVRRARGKR